MPLCISCQGEYWVPADDHQDSSKQFQTPSPPSPLEQLSSTRTLTQASSVEELSDATPADLPDRAIEPYVCVKCGEDNRRWHQWADGSAWVHFKRFYLHSLPWGWLALGSFLLPVLAFLPLDFRLVASPPIAGILAFVLIFVNVALLYALKYSLWRYDLLSRVGRGTRPQLALLAVIAFVLAVIMGLVLIFMLDARAHMPEPQPITGWARVLTTILLAFTFVNVALSAMFMAGHDFSNWLNREMPQPIFAQERRLLGVIEGSLGGRIRQAIGQDRTTGQERAVDTTIVGIERTDDAGVILRLNAETDLRLGAGRDSLRQLQGWRIETDRWGRIIKMNQEGDPRYVTVERVSINGGVREPDEIIFPN